MGMDVDDVGAVTLANALHFAGEAELIAVLHDTGYAKGVGGVSAINTFYNNSDVPVGAYKGSFGSTACSGCAGASGQDQYLDTMINTYDPPIRSADDADDAWVVYRRVLALQPDKSVNIASIGMLTNLALLLQSDGDDYSPLSGVELVAQKVDRIVYMDGGYNFGCADGFVGDADECYGTSEYVVENWPANVTQYFMDEGGDFNTAEPLATGCNPGNPGQTGYDNWCCNPDGSSGFNGRLSWDPLTVLIAVRGTDAAHMASVTDVAITVDPSGSEHETTVAYDSNMKRVKYTSSGSSQASIATDVDTMLCLAPTNTTVADDDHVETTGVEIKSKEVAGKCLDVWGVSGSDVPDYTNVDLYTCSGASNQLFTFDGEQIKHAASGKCLDNDSTNGDSVQIFTCSGASNQAWTVTSGGTIVNKKTAKCLDVFGGNTEDGTDVWTYTCSGSSNQVWTGL